MGSDWHSVGIEEVYQRLKSSEKGLSHQEAERRLQKYGKNEIPEGKKITPLHILLEQFQDFLIWILITAVVISFLVGHNIDAYLILIIVIANGVFGFLQDWKAEKSIEALKRMASSEAVVLREKKKKVDSKELVPGDVIFLAQGDTISADARIIEQQNMEVNESALTGESLPVDKKDRKIDVDTELAERTNMVHKQTNVVKGKGKAIVVNTGMNTQIGKIATELQKVDEGETIFQKEVNKLGKSLGILVLTVCILLIPILYFRGNELLIAFITAIALAVAAVPEGLPAVVTLTLALGTRKMLNKNALVRRLPVVESLGSIDVICTDKTGTLTESKMVVKKIFFDGTDIDVSGGFSSHGEFTAKGEPTEPSGLKKILLAGALCNDSHMIDGEIIGDPTEAALIQSAQKAGYRREKLEEIYKRIDEIPFSSDRKMMTTVHDGPGCKDRIYAKGAPEVILDRCNRYYEDNEIKELTEVKRKQFLKKNNEYASDALRVLAFAYNPIDLDNMMGKKDFIEASEDDIETGLIFLGLQGMMDPPREEVKGAIRTCRKAGIRTIMITGDNATTAIAIGKKLGFKGKAVSGRELDKMDEARFKEVVREIDIFARASPTNKVDILRVLRSFGHRVAMTGDGVNDAPALKESDVGISMGIRGTDVSQQASDMVLLDDNFATIEGAIEEGRGIFDNIKKFVNLLLSGNLGEVLIVVIGSLVGLGLPLTAVMLLWINLLTDGLPALAMGVDPTSKTIMERKPRSKEESIIDRTLSFSIAWIGIWVAVICLSLYVYGLKHNVQTARTFAFTSLVVLELIEVFPIRSRYGTPFISNKWLGTALGVSLLMHMLVLYSPLNRYFGVVPLGIGGWTLILAGAALFIVLMFVMRKIENRFFLTV
ncbi:MAG: cation-translocating P-type ATPase [Thermoplasmata archaeon]